MLENLWESVGSGVEIVALWANLSRETVLLGGVGLLGLAARSAVRHGVGGIVAGGKGLVAGARAVGRWFRHVPHPIAERLHAVLDDGRVFSHDDKSMIVRDVTFRVLNGQVVEAGLHDPGLAELGDGRVDFWAPLGKKDRRALSIKAVAIHADLLERDRLNREAWAVEVLDSKVASASGAGVPSVILGADGKPAVARSWKNKT